jgi:hypothetical protein
MKQPTKLPAKPGKDVYKMGKPQVALNLSAGFPPMKRPVRPHKRF